MNQVTQDELLALYKIASNERGIFWHEVARKLANLIEQTRISKVNSL
jgi:hypothetical protein